MSNNQINEKKYNDIHTFGMGYMNRARTVNPNQGKPYESVSVTALGGRVDDPVYTYYDCSSVIAKALPKYLLLKEAINNPNQKVMIRFKISDSVPDSYLTTDRTSGEEVRRHIIKCRLLDITWASIDGQIVQFELDQEDEPQLDNQTSISNPVSDSNQSTDVSLFDGEKLGEFVKLDPDDALFVAKKAELKAMGYCWDSNETAWYRPAAVA